MQVQGTILCLYCKLRFHNSYTVPKSNTFLFICFKAGTYAESNYSFHGTQDIFTF